jgi:hypothetical protein
MRFRVAAVQDSGLSQSLTDARLWIEDWLNRVLGDADFGCPSGCIMLVVFATVSLPKAPPVSRLTAAAGEGPTLALHVPVAPELVASTPPSDHKAMLCRELALGLPVKPRRIPKGLDYQRLRQALVASLEPFASGAA